MTEYTLPTDPIHSPERERAHLHTYRSGVWLPLLQAAITGGLIGIAAGMIAYLAGAVRPLIWGGLAGVSVIILAWVILLWRWLDLTRPLELITGRDLDGDGTIGGDPAEPPAEPIRVIVESEDGRQGQFIDLPASMDQLRRLADGLQAGQSFSESAWTGAGAPFSKSEFIQLREEMHRRGLVRWANPRAHAQGVELTAAGRAVIRKFASPTLLDKSAHPTK